MRLLIVDDQQATLSGIANNIDWHGEGFDQIDTARNAMEARRAFLNGVPDVMLCDIEMPVESGLQFAEWVRDHGYETKIVFLTCHAEFEYAQEAVRLKASGYIVHPAPYEKIVEMVRKIVLELKKEQKNNSLKNIGLKYEQNKESFRANMFRSYLNRMITLDDLKALPELSESDGLYRVLLIQSVHWNKDPQLWNSDLITTILRSLATDVFPASNITVVHMENVLFAIILEHSATTVNRKQFDGLLQYLNDAFTLYLPFDAAIYQSEAVKLSELSKEYRILVSEKNDNVTERPGIWRGTSLKMEDIRYHPAAHKWIEMIKNNEISEFQKEVFDQLDALSEDNELTQSYLVNLEMDLIHMLSLEHEEHPELSEFFQDEQNRELQKEAMHSAHAMKELIMHIVNLYRQLYQPTVNEPLEVQAKEYIDSHIWDNINRDDVAGAVHLNGDYLTRLFKQRYGMSVKSYIIHSKMNEARTLLQTTSLPVSTVAMRLGYSNFGHFSTTYKREFGHSPNEEKRNN